MLCLMIMEQARPSTDEGSCMTMEMHGSIGPAAAGFTDVMLSKPCQTALNVQVEHQNFEKERPQYSESQWTQCFGEKVISMETLRQLQELFT